MLHWLLWLKLVKSVFFFNELKDLSFGVRIRGAGEKDVIAAWRGDD